MRNIFAQVTAKGAAPVAIVRISGENLISLCRKLCRLTPKPRHAHFTSFYNAQQQAFDDGLLLYFPAPHSFTGEDVLELQMHGSTPLVELMGERLSELGCHPAKPGEFSLRAVLNDKMDLTVAEATADLINANSRAVATAATRAKQGQLSTEVAALKKEVIHLRTQLEASIDFDEEDISPDTLHTLTTRINELKSTLSEILQAGTAGLRLREGIHIALIGAPNVGKSTLLNALVGTDRAIVTPKAGTTRDVLTEFIDIDGTAVYIHDTAGLRLQTDDPIEREGMQRAQTQAQSADLNLYLTESGSPLSQTELNEFAALLYTEGQASEPNAEEASIQTPQPTKLDLLVYTKSDLHPSWEPPESKHKSKPIPKTESTMAEPIPYICISAATGENLPALKQAILSLINKGNASHPASSTRWTRKRHLTAIQSAIDTLDKSCATLQTPEIAAEMLRQTQDHLEELIGQVTKDDLLGEIFSNFCIGK